jgi:hypothetical protein
MTVNVICARCGGDPVPTETGIRCPACGQEATQEEAQADVQAHHDEMGAIALQRKAQAIGEAHPWISVESRELPKRDYKFITDYTPENVLDRATS